MGFSRQISLEKEHHISPAILLTARDADILDLSLPSSMNRDIKAIGPIPKITGRRRRNNHGLMPVRNRKCREKEEARARNRRSDNETYSHQNGVLKYFSKLVNSMGKGYSKNKSRGSEQN
jgi:hypothetical protein